MSRAATKEAEAARLALQRCEVRVSELEAQVRQLELRAQSAESATHLANSAQVIAERRVKLLTERVKALQSAPHVPKAEVSPRRHSKTLRGGVWPCVGRSRAYRCVTLLYVISQEESGALHPPWCNPGHGRTLRSTSWPYPSSQANATATVVTRAKAVATVTVTVAAMAMLPAPWTSKVRLPLVLVA